jgi:1,4-alpha-glucan branching enzyme
MTNDKTKQSVKRRKVTFSLEAADAREVILMGDFNNWNSKTHPMKKDKDGVWKKAVLLFPGKYEYKFLVDGYWKEDPLNKQICPNRFGTYNNILRLAAAK